jgi:hypothetical protein
MLTLEEAAEIEEHFNDEFSNYFKPQRTSNSLWADMYFYVIGDPMKQKDNKIRAYIKKEIQNKTNIRKKKISKKQFNALKYITPRKDTKKSVVFSDMKLDRKSEKSAEKTSRENYLPDMESEFKKFQKSASRLKLHVKVILILISLESAQQAL